MKPSPYALGTARVAAVLCCATATVARRVDSGLLPGCRLPFGSHRRVRVADLVAFADRHGMAELVTAAGLRRPDLEAPCRECGHPLGRHTAQGEGLCLDCDCGGWAPMPAAGLRRGGGGGG